MALPCASVLAPSSSLPPSITTLPDVPATYKTNEKVYGYHKINMHTHIENKERIIRLSRNPQPNPTAIKLHREQTLNSKSPKSSTELCRIRQLSLNIPSSTAGSKSGRELSQDQAQNMQTIIRRFITTIKVDH
jgi:hypothetical protein